MLPRLKQWLDRALSDAPPPAEQAGDDNLSTFFADDKLCVSESTITEFSRAIANYECRETPQP
jgi:hypothetical protein